MKKIDLAKQLFNENNDIFNCPVCKGNIKIQNNSLICTNRHTFDLSKNGYVNLLVNSVKMEYDKEMLEARNFICKNGFFDSLIKKLLEIILSYKLNERKDKINILDAGCGEGSNLHHIINSLKEKGVQGVGMDISKAGIHIAAREYGDVLWCVGDLSKMPYKDKSFDIILSIYSPSNYSEFRRVLKEDGILIKVVPDSNYLKELRSVYYDNTDKDTYSNERVVKHFSKNYNIIDKHRITYNFPVDSGNIKELIKMTPLSWNANEDKIQKVENMGIESVTVDLLIIVGKSVV